MLASCAGAPPATAALARIPNPHLNVCLDLQHSMQLDTPQASGSCIATPSTNTPNRAVSTQTPHSRRPNPHSARRTPQFPPPRFPPLKVFVRRPPVCVTPFVRGRHPKTFTTSDIRRSAIYDDGAANWGGLVR